MPPVVVTFVGFPIVLALLVGVHLAVRKGSRGALGAGDTTAASWRRVLAAAAGPVASYLVCGLLFLVAILGLGRQAMSLRVSVLPSGPAFAAGLRDGDLVVAMNGSSPTSWAELTSIIRDNGDTPIDMLVERGGQTRHFDVQPRDGRIGVASITERLPVPFALAAAIAIAAPVFSIGEWARELTERGALMGPVAINQREPSPWSLLFRLAVLASYAWPFSMLIAFVRR